MKITVITEPLWITRTDEKGTHKVKKFYCASRFENGKRTVYSMMSKVMGR